MTIEAFILCFNESKMIIHTLNYYSQFCDRITILDNQSTDNSINLVKTKFPNVIIEEFSTNREYCEDKLMSLRNNRWKGSDADWIVMVDMDEFLVDRNLLEKLRIFKKNMIAVPKIVGFNMYSNSFPNNYNKSILSQVKLKIKDPKFDKNIIFCPKLVKEMNFGPGSHKCHPVYNENYKVVNIDLEINLFHFKYLDREYLYNKHKDYSKRINNLNRMYGYGYEYTLGNKFIEQKFEKFEKLFTDNKIKTLSPL